MGVLKAIQALKEACEQKENSPALIKAAYNALEFLGKPEGIKRPPEDISPMTFTSPIDKAPMVLVPASPFLYGSRENDKIASNDEKPQRIINLPAFYIDKYSVTNRQYCRFLNQSAPDKKTLDKWIDLSGKFLAEKCRIRRLEKRFLALKRDKFSVERGYESHPVIYVSWFGATAYAEWAEKRLPTEQEWEKAARGTEGAIYPWGNEFDRNRCNSEESNIKGITPVDRFPKGKSPYGCFDMVGNVWEWTATMYDEEGEYPIIRGGSWCFESYYCRCAYRYYYYFPTFRYFGIGFRCARIYP